MSKHNKLSRRALLKIPIAGSLMLPFKNALAKNQNHTLLLIELQGGNDGLNTVIPFTDNLYYKYRPTIAIKQNEQIKITNEFALHNALEPLMQSWQANQMAIYLGLGYPNPNRSHFRSIEIWDTASNSEEYLEDGWLKPVLTKTYNNNRTANGLILGGQPGPLSGTPNVIELKNLKQFSNQAKKITSLQTENENTQNHTVFLVMKNHLVISIKTIFTNPKPTSINQSKNSKETVFNKF